MVSLGKDIRLSHLVKDDGKTLIVAFDHGLSGITTGIEDISKITEEVVDGGADGLLLSLGSIKKVNHKVTRKASIILTIPYDYKYVKLAAKIGVDGVKTAYFGPVPLNDSVFYRLSQVANEAEQWNLPYIIEVVPADQNGKVIYDIELVKKAARIGAEIGGDIVKTAFVGNVDEYKEIVRSCHVPIVIMGGEKMNEPIDVLKTVKMSVEAGAIGVAIGRNIWEYKEPYKMTKAISMIIHKNFLPDISILV